jgi:hypothetical protein
MACGKTNLDYQPFPSRGRLARHLNLPLETLRQALPATSATVYAYVVATVKNRDGRFVQYGSAPNWQGGVLTLCTCKHYMRTFRTPDNWQGVWLAGFTGVRETDGRHALVFLTRIADAVPSQADLWQSTALTTSAKRAKDASRHIHGDLFRPADFDSDPFDPGAYVLPHADHDHVGDERWHSDIDYTSRSGQRPAFLVGDPAHTYLYDCPALFAPFRLGRGQRRFDLHEVLDGLKSHL